MKVDNDTAATSSEAKLMGNNSTAPVKGSEKSDNKLDKLHLIADKRDSPIGLSHYLAVFLWLGWIGSYFLLFGLVIMMFTYSVKVCVTFLAFVALVTFIPIDRDTQPKWGFEIGKILHFISYHLNFTSLLDITLVLIHCYCL
jgi:hypothetical protein